MNDKDWGDLWDQEPDDDEDYNDIGSDIDANNDETFDNAAEWNEDEHEELIARDLTHTLRNNTQPEPSKRSGWSPFGSEDLFMNPESNGPGTVGTSNHNVALQNHLSQGRSTDQQRALLRQQQHQQQIHNVQMQLQRDLSLLNHQNQQPHRRGEPRLLPEGTQCFTVEELERQMINDRRGAALPAARDQPTLRSKNVQHPQEPSSRPMRTNEAHPRTNDRRDGEKHDRFEREPEQSSRSGWSPFGSKDLFMNPESNAQVMAGVSNHNIALHNHLSQVRSIDQQRVLLRQQQQQLHNAQIQLQRELALLNQHQQQYQQPPPPPPPQPTLQQRVEPRLLPEGTQCFTVEELERQMISDRRGPSASAQDQPVPRSKNVQHLQEPSSRPMRSNETHTGINDRREGEKHDRFERETRHGRDHHERREFRERREYRNNREHHDRHHREPKIVPPQVQLAVIDKGKRLYPITAMHSDEFFRDRMPTSENGFQSKRHSEVQKVKSKHDGVLTNSERSWLTRIQEKIQADYDDNLDQDYYYLLYFNRSSMADEAVQKPCGPGVLDRRFIPRERLLYSSGA